MKKLSMILTVLVIFGSSAIGHTSDECVVFEGTFEMSTRRPVAQFEYFQALDGEAILKVYDQIGSHHAKKVISANISINGKKVIGSRDFFKKKYFRYWHPKKKKYFHYSHYQQPDDYIEKTVELTKGKNSLKVMLNSMRGGKIKVAIVKPKYLASDDLDCDFIPDDGEDNCPDDYNPDQADSDGDGIGDVCDNGDDDTYPTTVVTTIDNVGPPTGPYGGIAVSSKEAFAYVSNNSDGKVYVINTSDNTLMSNPIQVGNGPMGVAVTTNGDSVYVSNSGGDGYGSGTVSVIRAEDNSVSTIAGVGFAPFGVSVTPDDQYAYVSDFGDNKVYVIRTSDNTVFDADPSTAETDPITVEWCPFGVSVTPDGQYVYVSNFVSNSVSVIRTVDNKVIKTIMKTDGIGNGPFGVSVTPDSKYAYVSNLGDNTVSVIRTEDNTVVNIITVGIGPAGVSVTPNGKYVYVNNSGDGSSAGTVSVIQTSDNTVIDTDPSTVEIDPIEVGKLPYGGIAVSTDGKSVYVGNFQEGSVSVIGF